MHLPQFPLGKVDGFEEGLDAVVAREVNDGRIHAKDLLLKERVLRVHLQVGDAVVKPLESKLRREKGVKNDEKRQRSKLQAYM